ncbi:unnamed protein product [Cyprideis torosa]|uniref:Uncharacterized protein n=1 Tax=Cyprideis torosa TaxID=163714 RepID=A0A7R8WT37_9CRUS|nr:unnamed protein product [Cyprideis torosa]CAG0905723.1 unnamed protein product [Cyprideis torosa]
MSKQKKKSPGSIAANRRARFEFQIDQTHEAGIVLEGWEVKSIRDGRIQITDSFVQIDKNEAYLHGATITPLLSASTHIHPDATRPRKLLLHRYELDRLIGAVERKGYAIVAMSMYWKMGNVKLEIGLGKGKKAHDKRATSKDRDWERQKERLMKQ